MSAETSWRICGAAIPYEVDWDSISDSAEALNFIDNVSCHRLNMALRMICSDDMGKHAHESAIHEDLCQSPDYSNERGNLMSVTWRLPSGYPRSLNGKNGFPNRDSDFVILEDDGIRQVIPGISSKYFVSSSEAGKAADYMSYGFDGEFGGLDPGCNGNGMASLRCVAQ